MWVGGKPVPGALSTISTAATIPRGRFLEQEHAAIPQPPDRLPTVALGDVLDECGQARREPGRDLVSPLLGETGVPGEVDKADGWGPQDALVQTGTLQGGLGVRDRNLGPDVPAMPLIDPQKRSVHQRRLSAVRAATRPA